MWYVELDCVYNSVMLTQINLNRYYRHWCLVNIGILRLHGFYCQLPWQLNNIADVALQELHLVLVAMQ